MDSLETETRRTYHEELNELKQQIALMGKLAADMLADAVQAVSEVNAALAESVERHDETVDAIDANVEARCVRLIALQQPVGLDLRLIVGSLKVITDLERVGDHAVDIAKIAVELSKAGASASPVDLVPIGNMAIRMLTRSVTSVLEPVDHLFGETAADAANVRRQLRGLQEDLLDRASKGTLSAASAICLQLAAVYLERVAAHATNVAERANYIATGEFISLNEWLIRG
jgi:phosphate transport system protein